MKFFVMVSISISMMGGSAQAHLHQACYKADMGSPSSIISAVSYSGPRMKVLQSEDTLMVSMVDWRDYQTNGPTPIRLWALPQTNGIYSCLFTQNPSHLRWNFYDWSTYSWVASDTGYYAYETAGYGQFFVNHYANSYQYYPVFTGHSYPSPYVPDLWWPEELSFNPFSWNGNYIYVPGEIENYLWPRLGITQSGYVHQITTHYSTYNIYYDRLNDMENPSSWEGLVELVGTDDGPWYAFNADPFGKTLVLTYCRISSDNHIIMLIDTMEGDMFYNGDFIEIDLSEALYPIDTLNIGFVGDGVPFVDRGGNIHHFFFGSNGVEFLPVHIWHFFYDAEADTIHWSPVKFIDETEAQAGVGLNTLWAGRAQLGQNRDNGDLYAIWEEFLFGDRYAVSSTHDTFPPVGVMLARSTDDGLTWQIDTLLQSDIDFGNHWLRFPLLSPEVLTHVEDGSVYDRVVWGVHEDYDPGFVWQNQGTAAPQVLWVGVKDIYAGPVSVKERGDFLSEGVKVSSYPNPAKNQWNIVFQLPRKTPVDLKIYDASGRLVRVFANGNYRIGENKVTWDLTDINGRKVSAGTYFYVLKAFGRLTSGKITVAR